MKTEFIKFLFQTGALKFGDFTLKSGRRAPYFINTGLFYTGNHLSQLSKFYTECIIENDIKFDTLFGPAYKGIPLAVATASELYNKYNMNTNYCFDRKEAKDHGEGGLIVGKPLTDNEKILIIEDVITAGTSLRNVLPIIKNAANIEIVGIIIAVDRMEKGGGSLSAVQEVKDNFGINVYPIITIKDIIYALENDLIPGKEFLQSIYNYREIYGV